VTVASCLSFAGRVLGVMTFLLAILAGWGAWLLYRSTGAFLQTAVILRASVAASFVLAGVLFFFGLPFLGRHIARSDWRA
jgi:hypothetical protein